MTFRSSSLAKPCCRRARESRLALARKSCACLFQPHPVTPTLTVGRSIIVAGKEWGSTMKTQRSTAVDTAVGARIRNLRLRNKLSQTDLGEQVGVTFQQIQKYENGMNRVSAGRLSQMAAFFKVPVATFYSEVSASNGKLTRRVKISAGVADTNINRLVKAFQALKSKNLKAAVLRVAEEVARRQSAKAAQRK
jgi:transcriptional regulator with XRE-family HTH domain